jgi:hypothetical protein
VKIMTKVPPKLMTRAEYSRHRGCTPQAVTRAEREGRITVSDAGLIDPVAADATWQARTRPRATTKPPPAAAAVIEPGPAEVQISYNEARRRQAVADAIHAERELQRQAGELVWLADVESEYTKLLVSVRETFLQLPARLVPLLVADPTPATMDAILRNEIGDALRGLSTQPL